MFKDSDMADVDPGELSRFAQELPAEKAMKRAEMRKKLLIGLGGAVLLGGALWFGWYELVASRRVSTDNAYVNAEVAQVTPQVTGAVARVLVSDTQTVKRGDILLEIDASDARIAVAQAEADWRAARQKYAQGNATSASLSAQVQARAADIARANAQLRATKAGLDKAQIDLARREELAPSGAVSGDELTSARNAFAAAQADFGAAQAAVAQASAGRGAALGELAANRASLGNGPEDRNPDIAAAMARLDKAKLDLARTIIRAPIDGVVANRKVQVGQQVAPGAALMTIVPVTQVHVDANFKESQLRRVRPGQRAILTSDLYGGDVEYHGRVVGFSGGTGSAFALIPAQNATGNWVKVVQRLPVRIALDPTELAQHPLRVGLSMEVEIDLSGAD